MATVAALLAAGGGTRARSATMTAQGVTHKLTAERAGRPLYRWALESVLDAGIAQVVVVTGAVELDLPAGVVRRHNPRWSDGQATSLAVAIDAARELEADALVVGLADQPAIPASAWSAVADADAGWPIVIATYDGVPGPHPVRFARSLWDDLPGLGDEGARGLLRRRHQLVHEVPCAGSPADIDTPEDLQRWLSS